MLMVATFLVLSLIIAILAVVFALQNADIIAVAFLNSSFEGSLALILLVTFAVGVITGMFLLLPYVFKYVSRARKLSRDNLRLRGDVGEKERGADDEYEEDEEEELSRSIKGGF